MTQQQKTAYEKKVRTIKENHLKKILIAIGEWTTSSEAELHYMNDEQLDISLTFGLITSPNLMKSFEKELKQAETLKTAVDLKREKEKKIKNSKKNLKKQMPKI